MARELKWRVRTPRLSRWGAPHVDTLGRVPHGEAEETLPVSAGLAAGPLCSQEHHFLKHGTVARKKS